MALAKKISCSDMETIAIGYLDIDMPDVKNKKGNREEKLLFNYDILEMWRNRSVENTREVRSNLNEYIDEKNLN